MKLTKAVIEQIKKDQEDPRKAVGCTCETPPRAWPYMGEHHDETCWLYVKHVPA